MMKRKFRDALRSKTDSAMVNETLCKVLCRNLVVLIHEMYELGVDPLFLADHAECKLAAMRGRFCLLVLLSFLSLGQSWPQQQTPSQQESNAAKPDPSVRLTQAHVAPIAQEDGTKQKPPKCPLPPWTDPFWPSWVMVIITGVAVWVAFGTLNDLKEQTAVAKTNAEAAKKSADALIDAERPWLFVYPVNFRLGLRAHNRLDWKVVNKGRTVANVMQVSLTAGVYRGSERMLPADPKYRLPINFYEVPLPPNGNIDAWCILEKNGTHIGPDKLTEDDSEELRRDKTELIAYAEVLYRDQFSREVLHVGRFCYRFDPVFEEFRVNLSAPAVYHKCT